MLKYTVLLSNIFNLAASFMVNPSLLGNWKLLSSSVSKYKTSTLTCNLNISPTWNNSESIAIDWCDIHSAGPILITETLEGTLEAHFCDVNGCVSDCNFAASKKYISLGTILGIGLPSFARFEKDTSTFYNPRTIEWDVQGEFLTLKLSKHTYVFTRNRSDEKYSVVIPLETFVFMQILGHIVDYVINFKA